MNKTELRSHIKALKKQHSKEELLEQSKMILNKLENHKSFIEAKTVMLYSSLPDEVDTHDFLERWRNEKKIILPTVVGDDIIPVELSIYDSDGQEGINIPNSMELSAVKEVAANMGSSLGSSINISTDAGAQLASDLGKGLIQGTSQYIAKKMRTVKVHLKSGYRVMLYQPED